MLSPHERISTSPEFSSFVIAIGARLSLMRRCRTEDSAPMKKACLLLITIAAMNARAAAPADRSVSLTQEPLVMRLNKDEFRIAFGINGEQCAPKGCSGSIRYRVDWKTPDGMTRSEIKQVNYTVSPYAGHTIAVDRQYFDTAEGEHTTDIIGVHVDMITCRHGVASRAP
jgi:hypothetical protein